MKTQRLLIALFFALFAFGINTAQAQSIDTVCAGATGVSYSVTNTTGSTYFWVINGGTQASGGNTNSITVDWNTTSSTDTLKVVERNSAGCFGDTVRLAVYRMPIPTASINAADTLCFNTASSFTVSFTGVGPWSFSYSDGTDTTTVNNISTTTYQVNTPVLSSSTTYTLVSVTNQTGCNGTVSGSAVMTVIPKPTTSAIIH